MRILLVLCLFSVFDVTTSIDYTCDRRAPCGCSKQSTVVLTKIVGGEPVNLPHSWGWIASLRRDNTHSCGATLLTPWYAITAAHCVQDITSLSTLSLNFGIMNLATVGQLRNITKIHVHPLFDLTLLTNDLALLRLHQPINITNSNIAAICLPEESDFNLELAEYPPVGNNLVAIGWGSTDYFTPIPSPILRQVTLKAIPRTDASCTEPINDDTVQFCAGYSEGGRDTCKGDSGGPLMLFKNGRWQLVGITSYGKICGSPGFAGIYTRVAYYDSYIKQIINPDNTFIAHPKEIEVTINTTSHLNKGIFHQISKTELVFIFVFIVYGKLSFWN